MAARALDAAFRRAVTLLAHDLRNTLGVLALQVEAVAASAARPGADPATIVRHADAAGQAIEGWAAVLEALLAFARGRSSSDLTVLAGELAELAPLRRLQAQPGAAAPTGLHPMLVRAILLELLTTLEPAHGPHALSCAREPEGVVLTVRSATRIVPDPALEWVVQFSEAGGRLQSTPEALHLVFPAAT